MPAGKVDSRRFHSAQRDIRAASPAAAMQAMRDFGHAFVERMATQAPRDTNRYVNGWIQAGNAAGVNQRVPFPLQRSGRHDRYIELLERQVENYQRAWEAADARVEAIKGLLWNWYEKKGRKPDAFYRRRKRELEQATRKARRAGDRRDQAVRALEKAGQPIAYLFIYGRSRSRDKGTGKVRSARLHRVLLVVYGGTGHLRQFGGTVYLRLHNLEAHASIVESRSLILRQVHLEYALALGLKQVRASFKRRAIRDRAMGFAPLRK